MKSLSDTIKNVAEWDGHIHLFNDENDLGVQYKRFGKYVGFMDLEYGKKNIDIVASYDRYIDSGYDDKYWFGY